MSCPQVPVIIVTSVLLEIVYIYIYIYYTILDYAKTMIEIAIYVS